MIQQVNITALGQRLRFIRQRAGDLIFHMAMKTGKSPSYISALDFGRRYPDQDFIEAVIKKYGLPNDEAEWLISDYQESLSVDLVSIPNSLLTNVSL